MEAVALDQAERIRQAVDKSFSARDLYVEKQTATMVASLREAEKRVKTDLLRYADLGAITPGQKINQIRLTALHARIEETVKVLKAEHSLILKTAAKEAHFEGMAEGALELKFHGLPGYDTLTHESAKRLAKSAFTLMDKSALDFLVRFDVQLAGQVSSELLGGIKNSIAVGIAAGKSIPQVARDIGSVIIDKEAFKKAGKTVFATAQKRIELIARTETLRAHNQGRLKFYDTVGVQQVRWMVAHDERLCPICLGLDGKVFAVDKAPVMPHPNCRCCVTAVPIRTCNAQSMKLKAMAGPADSAGACIMTPQQVHDAAGAHKADLAKTNKAVKQGDYDSLPQKQLQAQCKNRGISIYRTKADFIKLLGQKTPGVDYSTWTSKQIMEQVKSFGISKTCTKDDLIALLKQWDMAHAAIIQEAAALPDFASMTVKELQDECLKNGISISKTKKHFIAELEKLDPNPAKPHFMLKGQELEAKIKQFGIGKLKPKEMLVSDLQKALSIDKKAVQAVEEAAKDKAELVKALDAVVLPEDPNQFQPFLDSIKKATDTIAEKAKYMDAQEISSLATSLSQKKAAWDVHIQGMSLGDLKKRAQQSKLKHYQWHTKDELIARFTMFDEAQLANVDASVEAKWSKWAQKHGSKKAKTAPAPKTKPASEPSKPVTIPETPPPPKNPMKVVPVDDHFSDVDAAWEKIRVRKPFKNRREVRSELGGAHRKYVYDDDQGNQWMFKPISEDFRAHGDETAYRIGRLIDPDAVEVRVIELDGELGSIQRMVPKLKAQKDFKGIDPSKLLPEEIEQIQREHVIDWLISNHDGHWENFLRAQDGKLVGIDKGQLFKFLGDDKLSIAYHPNAPHGASEPFYNTVMRAFSEGKIQMDLQSTLKYIDRVDAIPDDLFLDLLRPYAERRFAKNKMKREAFYQMALDRKNSVRADFEKFYDQMAKKRGLPGFSFDQKAVKSAKRLSKYEEEMVREAADAGWQGKSIPIDVDQIEDQNALVFQQAIKKGSKVEGHQTIVQLKVRPEHEQKILDAIAKAGPAKKKTVVSRVGDQLGEDEFYDTILSGVKTVNHHLGDKGFNKSTIDDVRKLKPKLQALMKKSNDPEVFTMCEQYLGKIDEVLDAFEKAEAGKATSKVSLYNQYIRKKAPVAAKEAPTPKGMVVRKGKVVMQKRSNVAGEIITDGTERDLRTIFGEAMPDGVQYEIEFEDGVTAVFRPWKGNKSIYASAGELEIRIDGVCSPDAIEKALEKIERLSLNATPATIEDAELMYLQKQAYIQGIDNSPRFKRAMEKVDSLNTKPGKVKILRQFWNEELGVDDVSKLPHYDPFGSFQHATRKKLEGAGRRVQMRFDITDADLDRELKGYSLRHTLTNGVDLTEFVDMALDHNGAMISTVEKMRIGIKPGGMSPKSDMSSGGASYFFTRIRKTPTKANPGSSGLYFKKKLLRRMDSITYDHDKYGRCTGDEVRLNRKPFIKDWKRILSRNTSDETIFKYTVTLLDNIESIVAGSASERRAIIQAFKKHGITKLPDGRQIENIVLDARW